MAETYLSGLLNSQPTLAAELTSMQEFYNRRHWHQLTECLVACTFGKGGDVAAAFDGLDLLAMYKGFVQYFETKISPTALVRFVSAAATRNICVSNPPTSEEVVIGQSLLDGLMDTDAKKTRMGKGACAYLQHERLSLSVRCGGGALMDDLERKTSLKSQLNQAKDNLNALPSSALVDSVVSASYYRVASEYFEVVGPAESYYKNALMYLAYTPAEEMSGANQQKWAKSVSLAALIGEGVYNFGEVLAHDVLAVLRGTPNAWVLDMLETFNRGDIAAFNALQSSNSDAISKEPALSSPGSWDAIKKKITLLAVVELVFQRPAHQRTIPFVEIARSIVMDVNQVEWVVMRAMSVGLVKGVIDQVEQQLCATWVQPRVLDKAQMESMTKRLSEWGENVNVVLDSMATSVSDSVFAEDP